MPVPAGYDSTGFVPDPAKRSNHWLYTDTDEVFSFDDATSMELYAAMNLPSIKPARVSRKAVPTEPEVPETPQPGSEPHTRAELLEMAQSLGLTASDEMTDDALNQMVMAAISGAES